MRKRETLGDYIEEVNRTYHYTIYKNRPSLEPQWLLGYRCDWDKEAIGRFRVTDKASSNEHSRCQFLATSCRGISATQAIKAQLL